MKSLVIAVLCILLIPLAVQAECKDIDGLVLWGTVYALEYDVDPYIVAHIWWHESEGDTEAIGLHNEMGAWQFKWNSYCHIAQEMGREPSMLDFLDTRTMTETAVYGIANGYAQWWSTYSDQSDIPDWLRLVVKDTVSSLERNP